MPNYTVGQTLWFRSKYGGKGQNVTVKTVGRKYVTLDTASNYRFEIGSGVVWSGEYDVGFVYESEQAYNEQQQLLSTWREFTKCFDGHRSWNPPKGMTIERIKQAEKILFGDFDGSPWDEV